jgi:hypothetical protein
MSTIDHDTNLNARGHVRFGVKLRHRGISIGDFRFGLDNGYSQVRDACPESAKSRLMPRGSASLFDHLVGGCEQRWRHCEAERPGGFEVDDKRKFRRLLYRKIGRLFVSRSA